MNQITNNENTTDIQQYLSNNMSFTYSLNYADQYLNEENIHRNNCKSINDGEQNENESNFVPIVYKKRVRTKFNQEQVIFNKENLIETNTRCPESYLPKINTSKFYSYEKISKLDVLETTFQQHRYPTVDIIDELVEQLNLPTQKITIWFQNRRARLKKTQQKLDIQPSLEKDIHQQYDSGIQVDEDISHDSPASPPPNPLSSSLIVNPSSYYLPNSSYPFYNPMWSNMNYPNISHTNSMSYNLMNYHSGEIPSSFMFHDMSNYSRLNEFHGDL